MRLNEEKYDSPEVADEMVKLTPLLEEMRDDRGWTPWRTELSMYYENSTKLVCGQADYVATARDDSHVMIDFKRIDKDMSPDAKCWGKYGIGCMQGVPSNSHAHYSLQASIYCVMLKQFTGRAVPADQRFVLLAHKEREKAALIQLACYDEAAQQLLDGA